MSKWALPGPASFIQSVMDAVTDGSNVVIGAPLPLSAELSDVIDSRISECLRVLGPIVPSGGTPLDEVFDAVEAVTDAPARRTIASLMDAINPKQIIFVTGVGTDHWASWKRFIDDYANASRSVGALVRSQVVMVTAGVPKTQIPGRAPALCSIVWDGVVGEIDVFGLIIQCWRQRGRRIDTEAKLLARIVTRLALWDLGLAEDLLNLDPRLLFDPLAALAAVRSRGKPDWPSNPLWELGGLGTFDGDVLVHSMVLARRMDPDRELKMRLWAAQATELLPSLEVHRRRLAQRMKDARLKMPIEINGELVYELLDVELGLLMRIARIHRLPSDIVRAAEKYWTLRNKLAHLEPLDADQSLDPDVLTRPRL